MNNLIAIASDHAGFRLKQEIKDYLLSSGFKVIDEGVHDEQSVDYPDFANKVAESISSDKAEKGILICGTGIGMSIAANRHPGIRAALCHNTETAKLARQHNDANILVLGSRVVDNKTALECIKTFFFTDFEGGRHQQRVAKLQ